MKKAFAFLLSVALLLSCFSGCNSSSGTSSTGTSSTSSNTSSASTENSGTASSNKEESITLAPKVTY